MGQIIGRNLVNLNGIVLSVEKPIRTVYISSFGLLSRFDSDGVLASKYANFESQSDYKIYQMGSEYWLSKALIASTFLAVKWEHRLHGNQP